MKLLITTSIALLVAASAPTAAQGGLLKRMKQAAAERTAKAAAEAAAKAVTKSGDLADSAARTGVVGADSLSDRAAGGALGLLGRAQRRLPGALGGSSAATGSAVRTTAEPETQIATQAETQVETQAETRQILNGLPLTTPNTVAPTPGCRLEYARADNMWADRGQPTASPGPETLILAPGVSKVFDTNWRYEKLRNDGTKYYGSHMRVVSNTGTHSVRLLIRGLDLGGFLRVVATGSDVWYSTMAPGAGPWLVRADLSEAYCIPG